MILTILESNFEINEFFFFLLLFYLIYLYKLQIPHKKKKKRFASNEIKYIKFIK